MPKVMIPYHFEPEGAVTVFVDPAVPTLADITFSVENRWHIYHLDRRRLELLARDIEQELKAAPLPARGRSSGPSSTSPNK